MSKKLLRLQEILKRIKELDGAQEKVDFSDPNFPLQSEILASLTQFRFQGWQATRRGAKSTTFGKAACNVAVNNPGSKVLYQALTLDSAKGILWDCVEKELQSKNIQYRGYEREGIFDLKNEAMIRFFGVDSNYKEMKKILGQAYDLIGIDECGSMTIDMETLVLQMILAALSDREGRLVLLGTAEHIPNTFFQKVMEGNETSLPWKRWQWTTEENPYMARQFAADKAMILENNPLAINAAWFRTHWLNQWCADDELLIIEHNPEINEVDAAPVGEKLYGLGIDLGINDASSFTVASIAKTDPYLYIEESFKLSGMDFTDVANTIKKLCNQYDISICRVDGANKQGVEEMQRRHDLPIKLVAAEKTDKATFLRMMNDDYKQGKIKAVKKKCDQLITEQSQLMWIKDTDKEDPRCENHCNDGALYIWREMRNYFKPEVTEWKSKDEKMLDSFLAEAAEEVERMREFALL